MNERTYRYHVADVFTDTRFTGNMVAVFPDAGELTAAQMQTIARELNLAETTFVLPPERGGFARLRIFTPEREMPFAGHPTLGSTFVLVQLARIPADVADVAFEEIVGDVIVNIERRAYPFLAWLRTPRIGFGKVFEPATIAAILTLDENDLRSDAPAQIVSAGNPFLYVALRDPNVVDRAVVSPAAFASHLPSETAGVFFFAPHDDRWYSRMVDPRASVPEDPATGSATGPLGAYLARYGFIALRDGVRFTNEQGVRMQRRSLLHGILRVDGAGELVRVDVGGNAVMSTAEATMIV